MRPARDVKRVVPIVLLLLLASSAAVAASARRSQGPSASRCGGQLWRLKTLSDVDRRRVDLNPEQTTIGAIRERHGPGRPPTRRTTNFQRHVWELPAQVTSFKLDPTGALRLQLYDHDAYLNAVIPSPSCLSRTTRGRAEILAAWRFFAGKCGKGTDDWQSLGAILFVRGVGFWNAKTPVRGTAPNGAELHPVTGLRVVAGC
jgi:hypothetical protein